MSDTTDPNILDQIRTGQWRAQPGHVAPPPLVGADDPVAQMLASLPAEIPTTPVPDAVIAGETAGDLTPGGPDWGAAPPEELALAASAAVSGPQPAQGSVNPSVGQAGQEAAQQAAESAVSTVIAVPPAELQAGDVVQFASGPVALTLQNGDLWVCSDCTLRYLSHLEAIPVIRPT